MATATASPNKLLLVTLAFLFPPLAVAMKSGINKTFVLNVILFLLFSLSGWIHALLIII